MNAPINDSPYVAYSYAYPHKTAYRPLAEPVALDALWAAEDRARLFLYVHVPFCEMRCGFCNLFTQAKPKSDFASAYLATLERQARVTRGAIPDARFARLAVGGGTPTQLDAGGLERVFDVVERVMGADGRAVPTSVEASPETVTREKLALLRGRGVDRLSIGVQSFVEAETAAINRPQETAVVDRALDAIRDAGFPTLNVDLMYGLPGQTRETWLASIRAALRVRPEELYLYPLYVRPLTVMGRRGAAWDDARVALYRAARELLLAEGYAQVSMRMFRAAHAPDPRGPVYTCQEDGMVGLGCGARSYTRGLHYSDEYAVGARGVREILEAYVSRTDAEFAAARYGFALDGDEQRRRFAILSVLADGLDIGAYRARFGSDPLDDLPALRALEAEGLARWDGARLALTPAGLERSDAVGPRLYSPRVRALSDEYDAR